MKLSEWLEQGPKDAFLGGTAYVQVGRLGVRIYNEEPNVGGDEIVLNAKQAANLLKWLQENV